MSKIIAAILIAAFTLAVIAARASLAKPVPVIVPHCFVKAKSIGDPQWFLPCSDLDVYYDA